MHLDIMDVLRTSGKVIERPIQIPPITLDDVEIAEPVTGIVRAQNARQNIVIRGTATTGVRLRCGRCLQAFVQPLELELEAVAPLSFFQGRLHGGSNEVNEEEEADDELASVFDAHHVDVLELVRQAIVLQSPTHPLCSEDCPGLPQAAAYSGKGDERWNTLREWAAGSGPASGSATANGSINEP